MDVKKMFASAIRRGLGRRCAPVNSSRSTNEKNASSFQNMPRRTQAQILAADASAFIGHNQQFGHERVHARDICESPLRLCRGSRGNANGAASAVQLATGRIMHSVPILKTFCCRSSNDTKDSTFELLRIPGHLQKWMESFLVDHPIITIK